MGRTIISLIKGMILDDINYLIKGIILNKINEGFYEKLKPVLEEELSKEKLVGDNFRSSTDVWCQYCSNREICIAYYAQVD